MSNSNYFSNFNKILPKVTQSEWEGGCVSSEGDHYDHHECFTLTSFYGECMTRSWFKFTDSLKWNPEEQQRLHQTERTRGRQWNREARQQVNKHCNQRQLQWDTNTVFHSLSLSLSWECDHVHMINETHRFSSSSKRNSAGTGRIKKHSLLYNLLSFPLTPKSVQPSSMTEVSLTIPRINLLPWDIYTHFTVRYHTQNNSVKVTIQIFFSLSLQFSMETMNLKISQSARSKNIKIIRMLMKCTLKKRMSFQSYKKQWPPLCVAT